MNTGILDRFLVSNNIHMPTFHVSMRYKVDVMLRSLGDTNWINNATLSQAVYAK